MKAWGTNTHPQGTWLKLAADKQAPEFGPVPTFLTLKSVDAGAGPTTWASPSASGTLEGTGLRDCEMRPFL